MHGCTSYFLSCLPTQKKIDECQQIIFTLEQEWDPYLQTFATLEQAYINKEQGPTTGEFYSANGSDLWLTVGATSSQNHHSTVDASALAW